MIAAFQGTPYNILYLLHISSVVLGVGMAFIAPIMAVRARRSAGQALEEVVNETASNLMFPMFLVAGIAGGALVGLSDDVYDFQQSWLSVGGAVWMLVLVLTAAVYTAELASAVHRRREPQADAWRHPAPFTGRHAGADDLEVRRLIQDSPAG